MNEKKVNYVRKIGFTEVYIETPFLKERIGKDMEYCSIIESKDKPVVSIAEEIEVTIPRETCCDTSDDKKDNILIESIIPKKSVGRPRKN